jgi:thioesterase domain-containing protein
MPVELVGEAEMFRAVLLPRADERALLGAIIPDDRRFLRMFRASLAAMARYRPPPYQGHVVFLRATERQPADLPDPEQAWRPLVEGEFELVDVPGSHFTMMTTPHVETLARQLRSSLAAARVPDPSVDSNDPALASDVDGRIPASASGASIG